MTPKKAAKKKKGRKKQPPPAPTLPRPLAGGLLVARVWTGGVFLVTAWWKLVQDGWSIGEKIDRFRDVEYVATLERAIHYPPEVFGRPFTLYTDFLEHVLLPLADVMAPAILFFELSLGVSLVLGIGVRLSASLGVVMMLGFNLAKVLAGWEAPEPVGIYLFTVRTANWPLTLLLLVLALSAAGRIVGLDAWLRARGPRWLRWAG